MWRQCTKPHCHDGQDRAMTDEFSISCVHDRAHTGQLSTVAVRLPICLISLPVGLHKSSQSPVGAPSHARAWGIESLVNWGRDEVKNMRDQGDKAVRGFSGRAWMRRIRRNVTVLLPVSVIMRGGRNAGKRCGSGLSRMSRADAPVSRPDLSPVTRELAARCTKGQRP